MAQTTTIQVFQHSLEETDRWLEQLAGELNLDDVHNAYNALRGVLHTLRDRLTPEEATDLAAQLPLIVRGFYYEGWNPSHTPTKERTREEFLNAVREKINDRTVDPEAATLAVGRVLRTHVTEGQMEHVVGMLPQEIQAFFSE